MEDLFPKDVLLGWYTASVLLWREDDRLSSYKGLRTLTVTQYHKVRLKTCRIRGILQPFAGWLSAPPRLTPNANLYHMPVSKQISSAHRSPAVDLIDLFRIFRALRSVFLLLYSSPLRGHKCTMKVDSKYIMVFLAEIADIREIFHKFPRQTRHSEDR
jgi:hypothetical protein